MESFLRRPRPRIDLALLLLPQKLTRKFQVSSRYMLQLTDAQLDDTDPDVDLQSAATLVASEIGRNWSDDL